MGAAMGLIYSSVVSEPSSLSLIKVSRNGTCLVSEWSLRSIENLSDGWKLFRWSRKLSRVSGPCVQIPNISSIYLMYMAGCRSEEVSIMLYTASMKMIANGGAMRLPIAIPLLGST